MAFPPVAVGLGLGALALTGVSAVKSVVKYGGQINEARKVGHDPNRENKMWARLLDGAQNFVERQQRGGENDRETMDVLQLLVALGIDVSSVEAIQSGAPLFFKALHKS